MPLLYKEETPLRGVWKMEETSDDLLAMFEKKEEHLQAFAHLTTETRKREYLTSRLLLKELIGRETSIAYRESGAPFLPTLPLHISISHTKGYVAVILDQQPTGIDIEYISDRVKKIRTRFMNPEEEKGIDTAHETEHLLLHWCAKETLFKLINQSEVDFLAHLHVDPFPFAHKGVFTVHETRTEARQGYTLAFEVTPTYVLTWAINR